MTFSLGFYRSWGHSLSRFALLSMMIVPDICIAIGLLISYHLLHWPLGMHALLMGHIALCLPLCVLLQSRQFASIPTTLFHAAQDLGASDFQLFYRLVWPLTRTSLLSSFLLSCVLSLADAVLSYFLTGPEFETLPVYLFGLIKTGFTPEINAISTLMLGLSMALILWANRSLGNQHANL